MHKNIGGFKFGNLVAHRQTAKLNVSPIFLRLRISCTLLHVTNPSAILMLNVHFIYPDVPCATDPPTLDEKLGGASLVWPHPFFSLLRNRVWPRETRQVSATPHTNVYTQHQCVKRPPPREGYKPVT